MSTQNDGNNSGELSLTGNPYKALTVENQEVAPETVEPFDKSQNLDYNELKADDVAGKIAVEVPFDETGKLKPDIRYNSGEFKYDYETDSIGRIERFSTDDLQLTTRTERLQYNSDTPGKLPGDHAGHLAGDRFGGSSELDNLVSQSSEINLSQYKKMG